MILALSKPPYDIGARREGCNDGEGTWRPEQPYVLLREVTLEDWIAYCDEHSNWTPALKVRNVEICRNDRFFEVSVD